MKKTRVEKEPEALACRRKTTIGGQALIEGLMMIGPEKKAMAVRLPDGSVLVEEIPIASLSGAANIPKRPPPGPYRGDVGKIAAGMFGTDSAAIWADSRMVPWRGLEPPRR